MRLLEGMGLRFGARSFCPLVSKSEERRHELYDAVIHPKAPAKFAAVMEAIEMWEENTRFYQAAGSHAPEDEQKRQILSRMIPENDKEKFYELLAKHRT